MDRSLGERDEHPEMDKTLLRPSAKSVSVARATGLSFAWK